MSFEQEGGGDILEIIAKSPALNAIWQETKDLRDGGRKEDRTLASMLEAMTMALAKDSGLDEGAIEREIADISFDTETGEKLSEEEKATAAQKAMERFAKLQGEL